MDDSTNEAEAFKDRQRVLWGLGDYEAVAMRLAPASAAMVAAAGIVAGAQVLDVATGTGNAALLAARRGATVIGVDLSPAQLALAEARRAREGSDLPITYLEGDAEALPVASRAFDVVMSCFGFIFAPSHDVALAELVRACRPGGTIAFTAWCPGSMIARQSQALADLLPPALGPSSQQWGDAEYVASQFATHRLEPRIAEHEVVWAFPDVEATIDFFTTKAGPMVATRLALEQRDQWDEGRSRLRRVITETNVATDGTCELHATYLLVTTRGPN